MKRDVKENVVRSSYTELYLGFIKFNVKNLKISNCNIHATRCAYPPLINIHAITPITQLQYICNLLLISTPNKYSRNLLREPERCTKPRLLPG